MNNLTSLQRKLIYLGGIVILLIPITWLGLPAEPAKAGGSGSSGGKLAQLRIEHELGEPELGNVDPASSTMSLVLLGFRGIATSVLWMDWQDQMRNKDWAAVRATTESIILLQPHFLKVWHYQGWNLAYNISAEWDAVADRYYWVKEGIKFFQKGRNRNARYAELYWYVGDTTGKKIGRSDEWKQFRKFFREDPDKIRFQGRPDPDVNPRGIDNYLEAKDWFQRANDALDTYKNEQHLMALYLFRAYPYRTYFDYAMVLQREGIFDEVCRQAWADGFDVWVNKYGREEFDCPSGFIHLELPAEERAQRLAEDLKKPDDRDRYTYWVGRYQDTTNYRFWRSKARVESEKTMADAHRDIYEGEQAFYRADTTEAKRLLLDGMGKYQEALKDYEDLKEDDMTIEEALLAQHAWRACLELDEEDVPDNYPLKEFWEAHPQRRDQAKQEFNRRRRGIR